MRFKYFAVLLLSIFGGGFQSSFAQIRLPYLIGDGMVLQRDAKINIWGWAAPGEKVNIGFNHKTYKCVGDANGKWSVKLGAMKAGGPYTMEINASNHITIQNILIGDVWLCSGQSNMVLSMERVKEKYPEEIANANYPQIRNFFIPTVSALNKVNDDLPPGTWKEANPKDVLEFGAATYFFAKQLYQKYHIPIGIINSSVGGTPVQAWISEKGLKQIPQYADRVVQLKDSAYVNRMKRAVVAKGEAENQRTKTDDKGLTGLKKWYDTTYRAEGWHHFWLPGYWANQGIKGLNGVVWFRKEINVPASMTGKPAKLFMGRIIDADQAYVNGVLVGNITYRYPPRRYTVPANLLKPGKNVIVVRVVNTSGEGGFVPDKNYSLTPGEESIDIRGDWQYEVGQVFAPAQNFGDDANFSVQNEPAGLYNTMIAPIIQYGIKGILWYQGEANTTKPKEYEQLLPALIADWRNKWNEGNIPFVYAQLPGFMEVQYSPAESKWAELRETQLKTLSVPNTAMAVTIDAGEWNDIHPLNKKDVGERMALGAEKLAYGETGIVSSGPIYKSAKVEGNKIVIAFENTGSGLMAKDGKDLAQFAVAGDDRKYIWANARIEGDKVIVWNDKIDHPKYVRYAWADNPEGANLYNKESLPASPFTTDTP
jgi:sialate O-acetylesterase